MSVQYGTRNKSTNDTVLFCRHKQEALWLSVHADHVSRGPLYTNCTYRHKRNILWHETPLDIRSPLQLATVRFELDL